MIGNGLRKRLAPFRYEDFRTVDRAQGERLVELTPASEQLRRPTKDAIPAGFVLMPQPAPCAGGCPGTFHTLHEETGLCLGCSLASGWTPGMERQSMSSQERGRAVLSIAAAWEQPKETVLRVATEYALETGRTTDSVLADFVSECGYIEAAGPEVEPTRHEKRVYACRLAKLKRLRDELSAKGLPCRSAFDHPAAPEVWEDQQRRLGLSSKQGARVGLRRRKRKVAA